MAPVSRFLISFLFIDVVVFSLRLRSSHYTQRAYISEPFPLYYTKPVIQIRWTRFVPLYMANTSDDNKVGVISNSTGSEIINLNLDQIYNDTTINKPTSTDTPVIASSVIDTALNHSNNNVVQNDVYGIEESGVAASTVYELSTAKSVLSFIQSRNSNNINMNSNLLLKTTSSTNRGLIFSDGSFNDNGLHNNNAGVATASNAMQLRIKRTSSKSYSSTGNPLLQRESQLSSSSRMPSQQQSVLGSKSMSSLGSTQSQAQAQQLSQQQQMLNLHPDDYSWQLNYDHLANCSLDAIDILPALKPSGVTATTRWASGTVSSQVTAIATVGALKGTSGCFSVSGDSSTSSSAIAVNSGGLNSINRVIWMLAWWLNAKKWDVVSDKLQHIDNELTQLYESECFQFTTAASADTIESATGVNSTGSVHLTSNPEISSISSSSSNNGTSFTDTSVKASTSSSSSSSSSSSCYSHLLQKRLIQLQGVIQQTAASTNQQSRNTNNKLKSFSSASSLSSSSSYTSGSSSSSTMYTPNKNIDNNNNNNNAYNNEKKVDIAEFLTSLTRKLENHLVSRLVSLTQSHVARVICVGDVHGCVDELKDLIKHVGYTPGDLILLLGDMVAKGPSSVQVVKLARELGAVSVRGNHDFEVIRRYVEEKRHATTNSAATVTLTQQQQQRQRGREGFRSPNTNAADSRANYNVDNNSPHTNADINSRSGIVTDATTADSTTAHATQTSSSNSGSSKLPDHLRIARELDEKDMEWLMRLPYFIHSPDLASLFVHAGMLAKTEMNRQNPWVMMNMRSSTSDGKVSPRCLHHYPWAKHWQGPLTIYFGHDAARGLQIYDNAVGLDTGCVYGERLTAILLPSKEVMSVPARRAYIDSRKSQSHRYFASSRASSATAAMTDSITGHVGGESVMYSTENNTNDCSDYDKAATYRRSSNHNNNGNQRSSASSSSSLSLTNTNKSNSSNSHRNDNDGSSIDESMFDLIGGGAPIADATDGNESLKKQNVSTVNENDGKLNKAVNNKSSSSSSSSKQDKTKASMAINDQQKSSFNDGPSPSVDSAITSSSSTVYTPLPIIVTKNIRIDIDSSATLRATSPALQVSIRQQPVTSGSGVNSATTTTTHSHSLHIFSSEEFTSASLEAEDEDEEDDLGDENDLDFADVPPSPSPNADDMNDDDDDGDASVGQGDRLDESTTGNDGHDVDDDGNEIEVDESDGSDEEDSSVYKSTGVSRIDDEEEGINDSEDNDDDDDDDDGVELYVQEDEDDDKDADVDDDGSLDSSSASLFISSYSTDEDNINSINNNGKLLIDDEVEGSGDGSEEDDMMLRESIISNSSENNNNNDDDDESDDMTVVENDEERRDE